MANTTMKKFIPSFVRGKFAHIQQAIQDGKVVAPAFCFITDETMRCLAYLDIDNNLYVINLGRIEKIEDRLADMVDPETGEPVDISTYVNTSIQPIEQDIETISTDVTEIQEKVGQIIMITDIGGES